MVSDFVFEIPAGPKNNQAGKWTLKQLKLVDVTSSEKDANGFNKFHNESDPLYIDMVPTETNDLKVRIVQVNVEALYDGKKTTSTVEFTDRDFMESVDTAPITIKITDHNGSPMMNVDAVSLKYKLKGESWEQKGGYTASHLVATDGYTDVRTYTATSSNGADFTVDSVKLTYAGEYVPELTFTVNGVTFTYKDQTAKDMGVPTFTLATVKPTVEITARTDYANFDTGESSSNTKTSATVFFGRTKAAVSGHNYQQPSVSITLSGIGSASEANLAFTSNRADNVVYLFKTAGDTKSKGVTTFTWTNDDACMRFVGYWQSATCDDPHEIAQTMTADTLVMSYDGKDYSFKLPTAIVIDNPN